MLGSLKGCSQRTGLCAGVELVFRQLGTEAQ